MFQIKWTEEADQQYKKLRENAQAGLRSRQKKEKKKTSKAEGLFKQIHKTIFVPDRLINLVVRRRVERMIGVRSRSSLHLLGCYDVPASAMIHCRNAAIRGSLTRACAHTI